MRRYRMIFHSVRRASAPTALILAFAVVGAGTNHAAAADKDPPKVTAKELTAAFVKNAAAASKKYGDSMNPKELIIEGVVADVVDGKYGKIARLQGDGKVVV